MNKDLYKILIVDDDHSFLESMSSAFGHIFDLFTIDTVSKAKERAQVYSFDLILIDLIFEGEEKKTETGLDLIQFFRKTTPSVPLVAITKYGNDENFKNAIKAGADDFLRKEDIDLEKWEETIKDLIKLANEVDTKSQVDHSLGLKETTTANEYPKAAVHLEQEDDSHGKQVRFIGKTPKVSSIKEELIALSNEPDITVLLLGETGVGKEVAAKYLHQHGARKNKPFKAVNLSAVAETLIESNLFGHKKGAFTDAKENSIGAFGEADGGVLFLDEIGEINELIQVKLLRFLEDKIITPVGGKEKYLDVQIVAATNKDLQKAVLEKTFRSDLYERLNNYPVYIPPLRERREDIPLIIDYYLTSKGFSSSVLNDEIWDRLYHYHWPRNVRQLVNLLDRFLLKRRISKKERVDLSFWPEDFPVQYSTSSIQADAEVVYAVKQEEYPKENLALQTATQELASIEEALVRLKRKQLVCDELGLKNLDQLRYKINKYYEDFPFLFHNYPIIYQKYKLGPNAKT